MSESSFPITTFKYGLDTRKDVLSSVPGTLVTCENCHINPGGEVEGRKAFGDLAANTDVLDSPGGAQGTFGIEVTDAGLVVFGSARDYDEVYVSASGVASVAIKGAGAGATFNLTVNTFGAITTAAVNAGGAGYAVGDVLTLTTARGTEARLTVAILAGTAVTTVTITNNGNEQAEPFLASPLVGVTYQQLRHPTLVNDTTEDYNATYHRMTSCVFSENFNGKAFACALFTDGRRFLYGVEPDGTVVGLVQHSANGVVMENRIALADLSNDLARQAVDINWISMANRTEVTPVSITRVGTTATATYNDHGLSNGDIIEVRGATQIQYNGRFAVFNKTANTFDYLITDDPGATATGTIFITIYQAGSTLIDSPNGDFYDGVPSETAVSGQLGIIFQANGGAGKAGAGSKACFEVTVNAGTFVLTAPESADGTGTVNLCGMTISANSSLSTTATAIVKAINDLTFVHGYSAAIDTAKIYVSSNAAWGPVTFNLTVTVAGGAAVAACGGLGALSIITVNGSGSIDTLRSNFQNFLTTVNPLEVLVIGGTEPYSYSWGECTPGSANGFIIVSATQPRTNFTISLVGQGFAPKTFIGSFKITVRDAVGGVVSVCASKGINWIP